VIERAAGQAALFHWIAPFDIEIDCVAVV